MSRSQWPDSTNSPSEIPGTIQIVQTAVIGVVPDWVGVEDELRDQKEGENPGKNNKAHRRTIPPGLAFVDGEGLSEVAHQPRSLKEVS
jgi:hypothetical protein